jgi:hypothetical protein
MIPENPLEEALIAASSASDARPSAFYRLLLESTLFVVDDNPDNPAGEGSRMLQPGTDLHFRVMVIEGVPFVPLFSSLARLQAVVTGPRKYVGMIGRDLLGMIRGSHAVLNYGSDCGARFHMDELDGMLSGEIFRGYTTHVVEKQASLLLGLPAVHPTHLTDALSDFLRKEKTVKAAYLAHGAYADTNEPPHSIIGIDASGDFAELMPRVTDAIRDASRPGELVDVIQLGDTGPSNYMRTETKPFYKRKLFGLL